MFPFIPEGLGSSVRCRSLWGGVSRFEGKLERAVRTMDQLLWEAMVGGAANGIFSAFEKSD